MVRPRRNRLVACEPKFTFFKPSGVPLSVLEEVVLTVDELEAVKLKDSLDLDQVEASDKMSVSQPTFHRLLVSARRKIASALVDGKAIRIEGGNFEIVGRGNRGFGRGRRWRN